VTRYLDETVETMPRARIEAMQEAAILRLLPYAYERSGLMRSQWDKAGVTPSSIKSLADFREKAPVLEKDLLRAHRDTTGDPFGGIKCTDQPRLRSIGFTSGTTGDPTAIPFGDQIASNRGLKRDFWEMGLRPGDHFIFNILTIRRGQESDRFSDVDFRPICMGHAGHEIPRMLEACHIFRPTVFHHFSRPLITALEEIDRRGEIDLKDAFSSVKGAPFGGEPPAPKVIELVRSWGVELYDYTSLGDVCSAMECRQHDGMHAWEDLAMVECLAPESGEEVPEGTPGELTVTSLQDEIAPLVRFRSGDLITCTREACGCGRTHVRIKVLGRVGDQVVVAGRSIMPKDIMPMIDRVPEIVGGLFQIIRPQRDMSELRLRVAVRDDSGPAAPIADHIAALVREGLGVPASAEVLSLSDMLKLGPPHKIPRVARQ
jgi:phenylacetate-CoA ligase